MARNWRTNIPNNLKIGPPKRQNYDLASNLSVSRVLHNLPGALLVVRACSGISQQHRLGSRAGYYCTDAPRGWGRSADMRLQRRDIIKSIVTRTSTILRVSLTSKWSVGTSDRGTTPAGGATRKVTLASPLKTEWCDATVQSVSLVAVCECMCKLKGATRPHGDYPSMASSCFPGG